jgi:Ca-activated chloride channel homolog
MTPEGPGDRMESGLNTHAEPIPVLQFLNIANPQDEFFMVTFAERPQLVDDFTQNVEKLHAELLATRPKGRTALLDATYLGLTQMREGKHPREAILIISDDGDNHSRYMEGEIRLAVKEADAVIHAIGIFDRHFARNGASWP